MPVPRILISRDLPEIGKNILQQVGLQVTAWPHERPMTVEELISESKKHDALLCVVSDRIDSHFLQSCKHLKIISQFGAGYDNVNVPEATRLCIPVANTPGATSEATADIAFALMIAVSRKLFFHHRSIALGDWGYFKPKANLGFQLTGKTLGIFGLGRIGMEMVKRCRGAYEMNVIYHNRSRNQEAEERFGAKWVSFDALLSTADVLSVHCVLSDETRGMFNRSVFSKMKPGTIFINTSRGPVHNEVDLIAALRAGEIWGAGLDVTNPEPMLTNNPLLTMENVAVLPHVGSGTVETRDQMAKLAAENITSFYRDGTIPHLINPEYKKGN